MDYRKDIDCLRGISVIAVILYHLKFEYFSGGYLGVDIFFVISGFLITSVILKDINNRNFSLTRFYERRIRRIFPALIFVLIFTYIFFNQIYLENELKELGRSIISTILFYANFFFLEAGSYFNPLNERQPLLHTWSLSIEEQFYLIFPLLMLIFRNNLNRLLKYTIFFAALSILLSQFGGNLKFRYPFVEDNFSFFSIPKFAFYFTLTRIWEILAGCALAIFLNKNNRKIDNKYLTLVGYFFIIFSILYFDKNTFHPSIITIIPVIGTIFILTFSSLSFNKKGIFIIFNNILFLKIGLISYSLYLWHQPIYQFLNQIYFINFSLNNKILIILIMIIISFLSYKFIEQPFRKKNVFNRKNIYIIYISSSFLAILYFLNVIYYKDFSKKYSDQIVDISKHRNYYLENDFNCSSNAEKYISPNTACILGKKKKSELAFIGDSHLDLITKELEKKLITKNISAIQYSYGGCVPALNLKVFNDRRYQCSKYFDEVLEQLRLNTNLKKIILFSRWSFNLTGERFNNQEGGIEIGESHYFISINQSNLPNIEARENIIFGGIENFIEKIYQNNKEIFIVMPTPEMGWEVPNNLARVLYFKKNINKKTLSISKEVFIDRNKKIKNFFNNLKSKYNLKLIFLDDIFCDNTRCYSHKKNIPLFFDDDHMSSEGAKLISLKIFNNIFEKD